MKMTKTIILFTLLLFPSQLIASGWWDFEVELKPGYKLVRTNADEIYVTGNLVEGHEFHDGFWAIPPKITGLAIKGDLIVGTVESPSKDSRNKAMNGYFILDTEQAKAKLGLDFDTWKHSLVVYGISKPPKLKNPSSFKRFKNRIIGIWGSLITLMAFVQINLFGSMIVKVIILFLAVTTIVTVLFIKGRRIK